MSNLDDAVTALNQLQVDQAADQTQVQAALSAVQAEQSAGSGQAASDPVVSAIASAVTADSSLGKELVAAGWTAPNAGGAPSGATTSASSTSTPTA